MALSYIEMLASLKSGDVPRTEEITRSVAEVQAEEQNGPAPKGPAYTVTKLTDAEARLMLTQVLRHLEKHDLPKMIADMELLRRQLGMPSMLFKRLGDCL